MTTYLVRLKRNAELVGLFVSPTDDMLGEFVDECCDPYECEFVKLPPGGIFLPSSGAPVVPTKIEYPEDDQNIPDWFARAVTSELWIDIFYSEKRGPKWRPIEPNES